MAFTRIETYTLKEVLLDIRESVGETPRLIDLERVLRLAEKEDSTLYLDADDINFIEEWLN